MDEGDREKKIIDTALEEYKLLRAEILAQFQNRNQILSFGSAALAFLVGVAFAAAQDATTKLAAHPNSKPLTLWAAYFIPMIFIPSLCAFIITSWLIDSSTIVTIGAYLSRREEVIDKYLGIEDTDQHIRQTTQQYSGITTTAQTQPSPLKWERTLRSDAQNTVRFDIIDFSIESVTAPGFFGIIYFCSILYTRKVPIPEGFPCWLDITILTITSLVLLFGLCWTIRKIVLIWDRGRNRL